MIVATPGRLQDLVDRRLVVARRTSRCSCSTRPTACSTWASSRRSTGSSASCRDDRQTMFFSATLDGEVGELARRYTHFAARFEGELPAERRTGDVDHRFVAGHGRQQGLDARRAAAAGRARLVLVFVRTKAGADRLVEKLRRHEVDAVAIHGDKGQAQRETRARALRRRQGEDARRDRRRRARPRRRRHHARDQLRSARGARRLHAPRRPHRPRRARRRRRSRSCCPSSRRTSRASRGCRARSSASRRPACRWRSRGSSTRRGAGEAARSGRRRAAHREAGRARCATELAELEGPRRDERRRGDQEGARVRRPLRELRVPRREERAGAARGAHPHAARAARRRARSSTDAGSDEVGIGSVVEIEGDGGRR